MPGDAPTTFEWSTVLFPTKVWLILEVDQYFIASLMILLLWWFIFRSWKSRQTSKQSKKMLVCNYLIAGWRYCLLMTIHNIDVIMTTMASQITSLTVVYSTVYSDADQRKHQSSTSLAFVRGIHRGPVHSPQKWPVTRKMFPFDDVIMA